MTIVDTTPIIDTDSHISEPGDLWTSRVAKKWIDDVPQIRFNETLGVDDWVVGSTRMVSAGVFAMAGFKDFIPEAPRTLADANPAAYDPKARLATLDEFGVQAQLLFPNIVSFYSWAFMGMKDHELGLACVRAYNDFLTEFASADPTRLLPLCFLPFWDVPAAVKELERTHALGHRGVVFGWNFDKIGLPRLVDPHWDPILSAAQEMGMPITLHVAASTTSEQDTAKMVQAKDVFDRADYAKGTSLSLVSNINAIAELCMTGLLPRYPSLNWVSVESGFGYIPYLLEAFDWQWLNSGAYRDNRDLPMPSQQFRDHVYATFWFESKTMSLLDEYADNVMFETDFPHPTSLSPGPASYAEPARETIRKNLAGCSDETVKKVLWENAARLFHVEHPADATT